jgi:cobalt-zinc-cadmium efflux system membrane fusion protein
MRRPFLVSSAVILALGFIGFRIVLARPSWLPGWARFGFRVPAAQDDAGLDCREHGVPEKFCTLCQEELSTTLILCQDHGNTPEEICTRCHPDAQKKYRNAMCPKGHGLPREFCVECGKVTSAWASLPDDGWCATHNKPEAECPECAQEPRKLGPGVAGEASRKCCRPLPIVRLARAKLVRQVGIQTAPAVEENHTHCLLANAETAYDANHYSEISPRVAGFLRVVCADLGQKVEQGEVLAVVDSAEVSAAKAQLISAHAAVKLAQATAERIQSLTRSGAVAGKAELEVLTALNQAKASAMDAEQKLRNLGFNDDELNQVLKTDDVKNLLDVVAPTGGSVVARHAVKGEAVQATTQLFAVADTSRMWLWIDIYESDIAKVTPGLPVSFVISGTDPAAAALAFEGEVTWVGTEVNATTRTIRIRAELANPSGRLRANQFGQAEIQVARQHRAVVVPREAVQRKDNADLVFIPAAEPGTYHAQRVVARPTDRGDVVEIVWGVNAGQRVVTKGAFLLKTEIMKGAIGAGCCE